MIQPQNMNMVSNYITAGIALTTGLQVLETFRPIKGRGLTILFGDFLMIGSIPWIISVMIKRGTIMEILLPVAVGILLAIPLILTTKIAATSDGTIKFKKNIFLYLFLIGIPFLRRNVGFTEFFKHYTIFLPNTHIPDIELMIVMYVTVIVLNIQLWRLASYLKFRKAKRDLNSIN
ncbi:MAG: CcdC protein domain-containing protein [Ignavibacteriales bacterium]